MVKIIPIQKTNSLYYSDYKPFKRLVFLYKSIQIIFGLHFGFIKFKILRIKKTPEILAVIQCTVVIIGNVICFYINNNNNNDLLWFLMYVAQYFGYCLILIRIKKENIFANLIQDLRAIDFGLKVNPTSYNLENKIFITIGLTMIFRILVSVLFYEYGDNHRGGLLKAILYIVMQTTINTVCVTYAFMFYAVSCRMKVVALLLKEKQSGFLSIQYLYRSIVDIAEHNKDAFDFVLLISLLFNIPRAMITMYQTVQEVWRTSTLPLSVIFVLHYCNVLEMLVLTLLPAICAGMLTTQADNIRIVLHDLLLQQQDEAQFGEIENFIHYVELRGCRFRVFKLIPLDADLLGKVLHFSVTYLIVIIQFTNK